MNGGYLSLIAELKRRNVFRVGAAYLALAWVIVQITGAIVPALNLPAALVPMVVWIGVIGFPCVLIFSWVFELTPEGLKRESEIDRSQSITHVTGRRLDYLTSALLVVAIVFVVLDRFVLPRAGPEDDRAHGALLQNDDVGDGIKRPLAARS